MQVIDCRRLPSRARKHAATSPLSLVTAAAFPPASEYTTASSPARDHACVFCVCFILCDRLPVYRACREPCPSLVPLSSPYFETELCVTAAAASLRWIVRSSRLTAAALALPSSECHACPPTLSLQCPLLVTAVTFPIQMDKLWEQARVDYY